CSALSRGGRGAIQSTQVSFEAFASAFVLVKRPGNPGAGAVIAAREISRRLVIPVAVKLKIPPQIFDDLNGISYVCIETDTTWLGESGQKIGLGVQIGLLEHEDPKISHDEPGNDIFGSSLAKRGFIIGALPGKAG